MSCIRYGEGGKGMADGGCSVSSIEGVHDSYIVVISGTVDYVRHLVFGILNLIATVWGGLSMRS
ncbi:unnamed protein product [Brassica napus]|uniref:(rape) hypothetical protein n=1 Tax=Brassica napus TaxID=3708 RepID=A0A816K4I0_BRANA|nr:unnamed protein product [Brassica napus]